MNKRKHYQTRSGLHGKQSMFLILGFSLILLIIPGAIFANHLIQQRKNIEELGGAATSLRAVYDKILSARGTATSAEFGNKCYETSEKIGKGRITCGSSGSINISAADNESLSQNRDYIRTILLEDPAVTKVSEGVVGANIAGDSEGYSVIFLHNKLTSGDCTISEYINKINATDVYSLYCSKAVPDFLPGYTVEK